ncbi:MAG: manganese efflux pump [Deltaproteobacteria bacterium]|nr:manganese efflux pump [Deltaproteobacteria bacterium]
MRFFEILLIAIGLSMDAFAVAICIGTVWKDIDRFGAWRVSIHFGFFQFCMPVLGWSLGLQLTPLIKAYDHWVAFGLLTFVGWRMLRSSWRPQSECFRADPTRGLTLLMLSLATSIDALAVGLSLAFLKVQIWYTSVVIGVTTWALSLFGVQVGRSLGLICGRRLEALGGLLLIAIGVRILYVHIIAL